MLCANGFTKDFRNEVHGPLVNRKKKTSMSKGINMGKLGVEMHILEGQGESCAGQVPLLVQIVLHRITVKFWVPHSWARHGTTLLTARLASCRVINKSRGHIVLQGICRPLLALNGLYRMTTGFQSPIVLCRRTTTLLPHIVLTFWRKKKLM